MKIARLLKMTAIGAVAGVGVVAGLYFGLMNEHPLAAQPRARAALPADLEKRLRCPPDEQLRVSIEPETAFDGHKVRHGKLQTGGREAQFWFYRARTEAARAPAILVTPILGGDHEIERIIADDLASHGFHAIIVDRDLPKELGFEPLEEAMCGMIATRRRAIDWLETLPEVEPGKIGAYGVSLGGLVTSMLTSVEPRVRGAVIIMAGGDLASVMARSVEHEARLLREHYGVKDLADAAAVADFEGKARKVLRTCPLILAPYADPSAIYMVTTRRDTSVPSDAQLRLYEALGKPEMLSIPTGHYSAIIYLKTMTARARTFLDRRFADPQPRPPSVARAD